MDDLINHYGNILLVNLINKTGYEGPLGDEFLKLVQLSNDSRVKYTHFDFHKECSKMRWHRIQLLLDELALDLQQQGLILLFSIFFCKLSQHLILK